MQCSSCKKWNKLEDLKANNSLIEEADVPVAKQESNANQKHVTKAAENENSLSNYWICERCGTLFSKDSPFTVEEIARIYALDYHQAKSFTETMNKQYWTVWHLQEKHCDGQLVEASEVLKESEQV